MYAPTICVLGAAAALICGTSMFCGVPCVSYSLPIMTQVQDASRVVGKVQNERSRLGCGPFRRSPPARAASDRLGPPPSVAGAVHAPPASWCEVRPPFSLLGAATSSARWAREINQPARSGRVCARRASRPRLAPRRASLPLSRSFDDRALHRTTRGSGALRASRGPRRLCAGSLLGLELGPSSFFNSSSTRCTRPPP
jgi:hypothetical protein